MGSLLWNPSPGVHFRACDLIRNLLIASFSDLSISDLERLYTVKWIQPIESQFPNPDEMDKCFAAYLMDQAAKRQAAIKGAFETTMLGMLRAEGFKVDLAKCLGIIIYSRFHSLYEKEREIDPTNAATRILDDVAGFVQTWDSSAPMPDFQLV